MSQQINLYEERLRPRLELATGRNVGIAALVLLVAMAGWSLWERGEADRRSAAAEASLKEVVAAQEKMKALTQTMAERKVSPELANEVESAKSMVAAREDVIKVLDSGALGRTAGFSSFMVGFAQQARSDLWLTGFRIAAGGRRNRDSRAHARPDAFAGLCAKTERGTGVSGAPLRCTRNAPRESGRSVVGANCAGVGRRSGWSARRGRRSGAAAAPVRRLC